MEDKQKIQINGTNPTCGWAVIFAGGSASGKSTLIKEMPFRGEVLSTDTFGEEQMEVHNHLADFVKMDMEKVRTAEAIVRAGMKSRFPERNILNKVQNLVLDFNTPTVSASKLSALLSIGAHKYKVAYFKERIKYNAEHGMGNLILDMTGKEREVNLYTEYLKQHGYKVALLWVITNRSQALVWNALRRRSMKISGVHSGHKGPNSYLLDALQDSRSNIFDDAWLIFNSTESIQRPMNKEERNNAIIRLANIDNGFEVTSELAARIKNVLGPLDDAEYIPQRWITDFFIRYRLMKKTAIEYDVVCPEVNDILVSLLNSDKKQNEKNIKAFYKDLGIEEPEMPVAPCECYDVNYPIREQFGCQEDFLNAVELYPTQKTAFAKAVKEWEDYETNFVPNINKETKPMYEISNKEHITYKYDFESRKIDHYSKHVAELDDAIRTVESLDVSELSAYFKRIKDSGATLCFYGAGGAVSPATFATQLAMEQGIVAMSMTPLEIVSLSSETASKMEFLAISGSGKPADMVSATEHLVKITPNHVACLTTSPIDHKGIYGRLDNKVGQMIYHVNPTNTFCVNLAIHSDGFVATRKHVAIALLIYRAFHPDEKNYVDKLIQPDCIPFECRFPQDMTTKDITDLHILYGANGKAAANDIEGRMLECGVVPAMATDFKNFTHGRHVFINTRATSTLLMLITPKDEKFVKKMLKLIPEDRPIIFIRTKRTDMLGILQLMICTFYLGNELGYERGINMHSPGSPKWGGKLWSMKLEGYSI